MITLPNGKICMNEQEAIQWLLDNYPIPFQCSANYAADTEIGLGTIVNPTPAKVKVGSIIFFADSKVSTVVGLTANGFICSDQHNDLVDDVVYVSNVAINASGHLIVTLSNNSTIDAGLIKQISSFSIDDSQHLIANYNDGTNTDLGAIFSGNITISGNLTVTGGISGNAITGNSIIENMSGYTFRVDTVSNTTIENVYAGVVKNGNKITFVYAFNITTTASTPTGSVLCHFENIPESVYDALYPTQIGLYNYLGAGKATAWKSAGVGKDVSFVIVKSGGISRPLDFCIYDINLLTAGEKYYCRIETTFLLSNNLAA